MGYFSGHAAGREPVTGLLRVVAGVEVNTDVIGQQAEFSEFVCRNRD
jgi:hypothetical protein